MAVFEIGVVSSMLAFPFIIPFISLIEDVTKYYLQMPYHIFLLGAVIFLGQTLSIVLYYISKYLLIRKDYVKKEEEIIMVNTFGPGSTDEQHIDHKSKEYVNFYIVLTCVLEFILYVLMMIFLSNTTLADTIQFEMKAVPVFSVVYFNKFFLRLPFYRHHYFALTLIFFGAVSVLICHFFCQPLIERNYEASLMINFLFFIQKIFRGFKEVIDTYILQENNISPFLLLFYQGIIGTILCVLFAIGFQFVPCTSFWKMNFCDMGHNIENFGDFFEQFKDGKIISLMIGLLFASLVVEVLRMQTKYYLTAIHRILACVSTAILYWFILLVSGKNKNDLIYINVLEIVSFLIILFGELVYCEVIVCNFWKLKENTKKEIEKRNLIEGQFIRESLYEIALTKTR